MVIDSGLETAIGLAGYSLGAGLSLGAALWIARYGDRERPDRPATLAAAFLTSLWCA